MDEREDCWDKRGLEGHVRLLHIGLGFVTRDLPRAAAADVTYSWTAPERRILLRADRADVFSIVMLVPQVAVRILR